MALFSRVTVWVSNQVLTASALNGEFNNILNNAQLSSWIGFSATVNQMQQQTSPGGIGSESLAGSGSDELQRLRYMIARIYGTTYWYDLSVTRSLAASSLAVAAGDIAAGAVTTSAIAASAVTLGKMAANSVDSTQLLDTSVITSKINANAVTRPKLAGLGQQVSSSSGTFTTSSITPATVTNLSVTITTSGRPVRLYLQGDSSGGNSSITVSSGVGIAKGTLKFLRADIGEINREDIGGGTITFAIPTSSFRYLDTTPPAGTYTYTVVANVSDGTDAIAVTRAKLVAEEA